METTFSTYETSRIAGCTFRQLDYWDRTGTVRPYTSARGSGTQRRFTGRQAAAVWVLARLAEVGCPTWTRSAVFDALEKDDRLWDGPLVVTPGHRHQAKVAPAGSVTGLACGWVVDPRGGLAAVAEHGRDSRAA